MGFENRTKPLLPEKEQIISRYKKKAANNPEFCFAVSPHFIVAYRNRRIYENFGSYDGTDPKLLVDFLEAGLDKIKSEFKINIPDNTFQVIDVSNPLLRRHSQRNITGDHFENKSKKTSRRRWNNAQFSKVYAIPSYIPGIDIPSAYATAVHEAIGHGYVGSRLFSDRFFQHNTIPHFLLEGLATYVTHEVIGVSPHDVLRDALVRKAYSLFTNGYKEWQGQLSQEEIERKINNTSFMRFSIKNIFSLGNEEELSGDTCLEEKDVRGSSFVKFLIDKFGINFFKELCCDIATAGLSEEREPTAIQNYYKILANITGCSIKDLEGEWKREVLNGLMTCQLLDDKSKEYTGKSPDQELQLRKKALDIYLLYS
jgi:hypothetical protein